MALKFLYKKFPEHVCIQYAFLCMLRDPHGNRKITSKMHATIKSRYSEFKKWHSKIQNPGKSKNSREQAKNRMITKNPIRETPEKNHTAKETTVYFVNGEKLVFKLKRDFIQFIASKLNLTFSVSKSKIKETSFLTQNGILRIETRKYNGAKEISLGKKWCNNGLENLYIPNEQELPPGYVPGMLYKKRK